MQFVQPAILWGLLTLSIPILIHLFHFRRFKKVYFNNVHLLKEIKEETSNRNKVKNLLVLLTRLLALGALIFAFAQPFLSAEDKDATTRRSVQIFLDNSFSMESTSEEVPLFTRAKDLAQEVIDGHAEFDEYLILTHDLEAKHQRYVDQQTALGFIDEIKITPEVESLDQLMSVMDRLHDRGTESIVERYLISDFQSNISQIQTPVDTSISLLLLPVRSVQESNVTISDAKWSTPVPVRDEQNQLLVTLENYSSQEQEVELRMTLNGVARPLGAIVVPAGSEIVDTALINLPAIGWQELVLEITDYPIAFDNEYFAAFQMREEINILNIHEGQENVFMRTAFESTDYYKLSQTSKNGIRYESLPTTDLIVLNDLKSLSTGLIGELVKYAQQGGNLLIFPALEADLPSYNALLAKLSADQLVQLNDQENRVTSMNTDAFVFTDVYESQRLNTRLPQTNQYWNIRKSPTSRRESLLQFQDGQDYLTQYTIEKGNVFLCSVPLDEEVQDLVRNAEVFVPMLFKMAITKTIQEPLSYVIGRDEIIPIRSNLISTSGRYLMTGMDEFIPGVTPSKDQTLVDVRDQVSKAGVYTLSVDAEEKVKMAFNYDRIESNVTYEDLTIVAGRMGEHIQIANQQMSTNLASVLSTNRIGVSLWRWFLAIALLSLLVESLLLRYWK